MNLRKAKACEAPNILKFYEDIIESIRNSEFKPKWNEKYPDLDYIKTSIEKEELYVCCNMDKIISSFILNNAFDNNYSSVKWQINANPSEIFIIHTFAINSHNRSKGLSSKILNEIKKIAHKNNVKTIRIDIIDGNTGAEKVFEKLGFKYITTVEINHHIIGLQNFKLYEYVLKKE